MTCRAPSLSLSLSSLVHIFSSVSKVRFFLTHPWCRNNIIVSFQTEPTLKVLLISLKAGGWEMSEMEMTTWQLQLEPGEGLNLQAANHIFIMDPWWGTHCGTAVSSQSSMTSRSSNQVESGCRSTSHPTSQL